MNTLKLETKNAPDLGEIKTAIEAHATATAETIAKLRAELDGTKEELRCLEQKTADGLPPGILTGRDDLAATLVKDDLVTSLAGKHRRDGGQITVKAADLIGLERKSTVTDNDSVFHNVTAAGIFGGLERRRFIFDALPRVAVATGHVAVVRETSFTNNAAVTVAGSPAIFTEGAPKAESDIVFETVDLRLPTIAHFVKASVQALADVGQLRALLDSRLRHGLRVRQDAEILATLTTVGNFTAFTPTSGDDAIASVNRALAALEANDAQGTLIILNPGTWRSIQRIRAVAGDGQHIVGNPQQVTGEMLWGVPVLVSNSMPADKLLVLDTATLGEYYSRQDATIDVGFVNDDFTRNLVTVRAELRGALQVVRPVSVAYGDLTAA